MSEKKEFEPLDVGATERVDWKVAQGLSKYVHFDENGDAVIGKNLKIKGTTKLIGGLKPIHQYSFTDNEETIWHLEDYGSVSSAGNSLISLNDEDGNYFIYGIGYYDISNQIITSINILGFNTYDQCYESIYYDGEKIIVETVAYLEDVQNKLFTHTLTLTADKSYTLVYQSTNNLLVNSIADLRTIMNVNTTNDNVILPVCATDLSGTAVLQVTTALCKIGTTNVTAISDKVLAL